MRVLWRWLGPGLIVLVLLAMALAAPVVYVETRCQGTAAAAPYDALIDPAYHRAESRTLMTYPEWHIVHAYADYAEVLKDGDPHEYDFTRGVTGFWSSLCGLSQQAAALGTVDDGTKQMVYVIGVSFTLELAMKALYEETIGRLFVLARGEQSSPLDRVSADQASAYAAFLQQVPWYKWPFRSDADALTAEAGPSWRDWERRIALGLEYRFKALYAGLIAQAVDQVGPDAPTLRMILANVPEDALVEIEGVNILAQHAEGIEVEAPRYRKLTGILETLAQDDAAFVEIAGNDDIMFTALSDSGDAEGAIYSAPRQGFGDHRHLFLIKVTELAEVLRSLDSKGLRLEHIHDY